MKKFLIETEASLEAMCMELKNNDFLSIDTEFVHVKTFFPMLSLIQIAGKDCAIAVDIQAITNYDSLNELFGNPSISFVFHAMSQDLIALHFAGIKIPKNIFDTQIAGAFLGFGESISYAKLVKHFYDIELDKTARHTDWSVRPLAQPQINYALDDVIWLHKIYEDLLIMAKNENKLEWIYQEIKVHSQEDRYIFSSDDSLSKVKVRNNDPDVLGVLSELANLREKVSIEENMGRKKTFKDEDLVYIAEQQPLNYDDIRKLYMCNHVFVKKHRKDIIQAVKKGLENPVERKSFSPFEQQIKEKSKTIASLLRSLLIITSNNTRIATSIISKSDLMDQYAFDYILNLSDEVQELEHNYRDKYKIFKTWRHEVFGYLVDQLLNNEIAISIENGIVNLNNNKSKD